MATPIGFDPTTVNQDSTGQWVKGQFYDYNGSIYRFVKTADAVNATNGMVAEWASTTDYVVTVDRAGGSSLGRLPAGVFVASVTAGNYGFLLVFGRHSAVRDAANALTAGIKVVSHATTDGDAAPAAAYTGNTIGTCLANASGGTGPVEVAIGV